MSMERARRARLATQTTPMTWEIPAIATLVGLGVLLATPLMVQGAVARVVTGEFGWPRSGNLFAAYSGLLDGRFGVGLDRRIAQALPSAEVMWALTGLGAALMAGTAAAGGRWLHGQMGHSGTDHGLADPHQAAEALGTPRLRASAAVVRPDLYGRNRGRAGLRTWSRWLA